MSALDRINEILNIDARVTAHGELKCSLRDAYGEPDKAYASAEDCAVLAEAFTVMAADGSRVAPWPAPGSISESDLVHRVCGLLSEVWNHFEPNASSANDCFCRARVFVGGNWRSSGQAIAWVESVIRAELQHMANPLPKGKSQ